MKASKKFEDDPFALRSGERICGTCHKINPRFCKGHPEEGAGNDAGSSDSQGEKKKSADQNDVSKENDKHREFKNFAPYGRLFRFKSMPELSSIAMVPQKAVSLSEKELMQWQSFLSSLKAVFELFKKALKDLEHEKGPSGKNFHGYWSRVIGNEFQFNIPDEKDRADFLTLLENKFPPLKLVPTSQAIDPEEEKNQQAKLGRRMTPFEMEYARK